jgi:Tol biopolymer transport system component
MNTNGSNRAMLINDRDPHYALSACDDGKTIVYNTWHDGETSLWRSAADGSNPIRLSPGGTLGGGLCLPGSKAALYAGETSMWLVSIDGGQPQKFGVRPTIVGFSPDGKMKFITESQVANGSMKSHFAVTVADTGAPMYQLEVPYGAQFAQFTPDSKAIAFVLSRNRAGNIWKLPLTGKEPIQITHFATGEIFAYSWSRDGQQLALSRGQRKTDVVMMSGFH